MNTNECIKEYSSVRSIQFEFVALVASAVTIRTNERDNANYASAVTM